MNGSLDLPALPGLPLRCPSGIIELMDEQTERTSTVQTTVRKTFKYKLKPTPQPTAVLEQTLVLCRTLYNCGLEDAARGGDEAKAEPPPTPSRRRSCLRSRLPSRSMPPSIPRCCRMCWLALTIPSRRSFGGCRRATSRGTHASRGR